MISMSMQQWYWVHKWMPATRHHMDAHMLYFSGKEELQLRAAH